MAQDRTFKKWMADARREAKQGDCTKIGELYKVMAKNHLRDEELEDLFNGNWFDNQHGKLYELKQGDKDHLRMLHDMTCLKWHLDDSDY